MPDTLQSEPEDIVKEIWCTAEKLKAVGISENNYSTVLSNKEENLVSDPRKKYEVWSSHFEKLANDSSGNNKCNKKRSSLMTLTEAAYPECNSTVCHVPIDSILSKYNNLKIQLSRDYERLRWLI
ncbi:hypothetical protein BB561_006460 [Smittium simulii]|uniref:Uncharacterized protein n=1 Tax=Smittium simulii TaxID=133385 RepID=A0A2T9Y429_9FUNG|nr:hypothetical protein BB561_006460 [Smittium simulii]